MLATFTVTNLNDATVNAFGNAPGTFRQAIFDANATPDADIIDFAPGLSGDLRLSIADDSAVGLSAVLVTTPITIQGNVEGITIRRDVNAPDMRFFRIAVGGDLTLNSLSLVGGFTKGVNGAPGQNGGSAFGGAIYNLGNLQVFASTLSGNGSTGGNAGSGAASGFASGGAIFNEGGNVTIHNSTFSGNSVSNGSGPLVERSFGGGIYSKNGNLNVFNSTITNGVANSGRHIYAIGIGPGQTANVQINSSIIAQSDIHIGERDFNATYDLDGQVNVSGSNNIMRWQNGFPTNGYLDEDPLLAPLSNNGGPTRTHALLSGSPAIGHGANPLALSNDQRGADYSRVVGGTIDIGAFEVQTVETPTLLGDYNANQVVDAADYVLWRKTMGTPVAPYTGADGNGSSSVDSGDYGVWRGNFGAMPPAAAATFAELATSPITSSVSATQADASEAQPITAQAIVSSLAWPISKKTQSSRSVSCLPSPDASSQEHSEAILAVIISQPDSNSLSLATDWPDKAIAQAFAESQSDSALSPQDEALTQWLRQTAPRVAASIGKA